MKNLNQSTATELSGSRIILEAFLQEGVKTVFGYPGGAIIPIYDALYDYKISWNISLSAMSRQLYMLRRDWPGFPGK